MGVLPIIVVPDKVLKTKAQDVVNIDEELVLLAKDMAETMYKAPGIGLAANQVGELVRLIVLDVEYAYADPKDKVKRPIFLINPKVTACEGECLQEEGCLSVPELTVEIERPECITVEGIDLEGNPVKIDAGGILARAIQHELDHLDGATILKHASPLKRRLYTRKINKKARSR